MQIGRLFSLARSLIVAAVIVIPALAQSNPYESNIRAFEAADVASPPRPNSIDFVGSSSIVNWVSLAADFPRYNVLNRGFGGSSAPDALFFFDRIVTPYRPPIVVFYEGDNDIAAGRTPDQVFNDWTNFVGRVRAELPNTHIVYISIKPSPSRAGDLPDQRAVNDRVRAYTTTDPKLHFADVFTPMLTPSGDFRPELYVSDQLHMTPAGYAIWRTVVAPLLDQIADAYPIQIAKPETNAILIDVGAAESTTSSTVGTSIAWNNINATLAGSNTGVLPNLVTTAGSSTMASLRMVSRFNGANENGTTASTLFPANATRDSLFGNTETFNGLANVTPIFKLTGLNSSSTYRFTFYASRTGVSDNRQTRYTVTGGASATVDLNVANNIDQVASIASIAPDAAGECVVALTPGPSNNNANHFTYLGVLRVDDTGSNGASYLFDFGASTTPMDTQTSAPTLVWNNLTPAVGATDSGSLPGLVATNGAGTSINLQMTSRFNAANSNGATASTIYPATATQDSLFGNTETFGGFANIAPAFKFQNLNPSATYDFTFFASRAGVSDNRQTRYTVLGATTAQADLDAANNTNATASVFGIKPDANREIAISLTPGPANTNPNHFTYLGVLQVNWNIANVPAPIVLTATRNADQSLTLHLSAVAGMTYKLQSSVDLKSWQTLQFLPLTASIGAVQIAPSASNVFVRAVQ